MVTTVDKECGIEIFVFQSCIKKIWQQIHADMGKIFV